MLVSLIVAMGRNRVIGTATGLPWHLPRDLKQFRAITTGKPIVMGRRTFEHIGRPLPDRPNIVLTHRRDFAPEGVVVAHSVEEAIVIARCEAQYLRVRVVVVIDARSPSVKPLSLAAIADDVPPSARVVLWGMNRDGYARMLRMSGAVCDWLVCDSACPTGDVVAQCVRLVS